MSTGASPFRYGLGMLGSSLPINMIRGSMLLFYVEILGLDVRAYGAVMVVYAIIDAIDNPILGHLSDRTRTRFGRRRPWMAVGAVMMAACLVGFFSAPTSLDGVGLVVWFAVFAILCEAADSMVMANYGALLPELFTDESRRAVANGMRQGMQLVAMVIALALTPLFTTKVFGTEDSTVGFGTTAMVYAGIALVALAVMIASTRESPGVAAEAPPKLLPSLKAIVTTPIFWTIGLASACYLIPLAMVLAGLQLYVKHTLKLPVADSLILQGVVIVVAAGFLWLWTQLVRRYQAPRIWRISFAFLAVGFVPLYFAQSLGQAIAAGCLIAVGWAGLMATNDLIQARLLDQDARTHGIHREGVFLSAFGFFGRLSGGLNGLALGSLGALFGYYSGDNPGPDPGRAFQVYMSIYPCLVAVVGLGLALLTRVPEAGRDDESTPTTPLVDPA